MNETDKREMRERAREIAYSLLSNDHLCFDERVKIAADEIVAFAAAQRDAERERCCRDVCIYCCAGIPFSKIASTPWMHEDKQVNGSQCRAAAIRSRVAAKKNK